MKHSASFNSNEFSANYIVNHKMNNNFKSIKVFKPTSLMKISFLRTHFNEKQGGSSDGWTILT